MTGLVQLHHPEHGRRVAVIEGEQLRLLRTHRSIHDLAWAAIGARTRLPAMALTALSPEALPYDPIYRGESDWTLLPAFDHPDEPARCLVTGTGLTHKASAANRQAMHEGEKGPVVITDSMRMYQWGLDGGRPAPGTVGVQPEWFYKGHGTILRAHGEPLEVPSYANDGGEEGEVAGAYLIDPAGQPRRVGFVVGNEFSDHVMEKQNYLYLAPSKLRACAIGPELIVDADFRDVQGTVRIERGDQAVWSHPIRTGEANMSHTVVNLEHHHFKYAAHRRPGDVHIHFFGADVFSFGGGVVLEDGDVMAIGLSGFGRALRNPIRLDRSPQACVTVEPV